MKILYILPSYNISGGTPKKTLDLMKSLKKNCCLYVYKNDFSEHKKLFQQTHASIYEGNFDRNIFAHIKILLNIIDNEKVDIVQTQFSFGEIIGYFIKLLRPHVKLIVAFVGPFKPQGVRRIILKSVYKKVDMFVFVSNYVMNEKCKQFPVLLNKHSRIIYNGVQEFRSNDDCYPKFKPFSLYSTSGLVDWKNLDILIESIKILKDEHDKAINLYISGDGPERGKIEEKIKQYNLHEQVFLLGYQNNIGALLEQADIYVHPAYAEGFGIAVAESMIAGKPIIVSDAGALPELIENNKCGFVVNAFNANSWVEAILALFEDKELASEFGRNAKRRAQRKFSLSRYVCEYNSLYKSLLKEK